MAISRPRYKRKKQRYQTNRTGSKSKFERGLYKPMNEEKYRQPQDKYMNSQIYPEYRSSWEKKFFKYCDMNPEIEYWTAEPFSIPYVSPKDGQVHRYFPDVLIKKNGKKYLIEIKPSYQTSDPVNIAKWESAKQFCEKYGLEFVVLTEKELGV
jgi:predicted nuclease of restriction endonuclease-like RecB superfamily